MHFLVEFTSIKMGKTFKKLLIYKMYKRFTRLPKSNTFLDSTVIPVVPVVLCGGYGSRLWPLSRSGFPKQFLVLSGDDSNQSLFQQAIQRIHGIGEQSSGNERNNAISLSTTLVVTNEERRFLASDQLRELKDIHASLLLEPVGRNTAPALTLAALKAKEDNGAENTKVSLENNDPILVITPADQTIQNQVAFVKAIQDFIAVVNADINKQTIVILGITPDVPETGYGYIIKRNASQGVYGEYPVECFVEKPDLNTAHAYLADGNYFWNSGMLVMYASTWITSLKEFRPDIYGATETAWVARTTDKAGQTTFIRPEKEIFKKIASESIDYAVIERCPESSKFNLMMVELNAGWNDLGAWDAVWKVGKQDLNGNVTSGGTITSNCRNSLIHSSVRLVSAVGVDNLIIIETADAVLVADRKNCQDVKILSTNLSKKSVKRKTSIVRYQDLGVGMTA